MPGSRSPSIQRAAAVFLAALGIVLAASLPGTSQDTDAQAWQDVITGQIEAFRAGDAAGALVFAGAGFKAAYEDPERFQADILASGYGPILQSRAHSFGGYQRPEEGVVLQLVSLVGPDGGLYEAIYQMALEPEGWRVQGVALQKVEAMNV